MSDILFGRNPVLEAIKSGREIDKILMIKNGEGSIKKIETIAKGKNITLQYVDRQALDRIAAAYKGAHQGVIAYVSSYKYCQVDDIISMARNKGEDPFLILLDGIEDPHNLGAIIRTADGAGAHGVIITRRRMAGLTQTVAKASAGAVEYVPVARVANLVQIIEMLKAKGLWIAACDMGGDLYFKKDLTGPIALVIGSEGKGIGRLVREKCDFIISIPMKGRINSLNASNAAAVIMYDILRQRLKI
jgi:23S rRNA (guanosine2251-2'-O)-methyltransferase